MELGVVDGVHSGIVAPNTAHVPLTAGVALSPCTSKTGLCTPEPRQTTNKDRSPARQLEPGPDLGSYYVGPEYAAVEVVLDRRVAYLDCARRLRGLMHPEIKGESLQIADVMAVRIVLRPQVLATEAVEAAVVAEHRYSNNIVVEVTVDAPFLSAPDSTDGAMSLPSITLAQELLVSYICNHAYCYRYELPEMHRMRRGLATEAGWIGLGPGGSGTHPFSSPGHGGGEKGDLNRGALSAMAESYGELVARTATQNAPSKKFQFRSNNEDNLDHKQFPLAARFAGMDDDISDEGGQDDIVDDEDERSLGADAADLRVELESQVRPQTGNRRVKVTIPQVDFDGLARRIQCMWRRVLLRRDQAARRIQQYWRFRGILARWTWASELLLVRSRAAVVKLQCFARRLLASTETRRRRRDRDSTLCAANFASVYKQAFVGSSTQAGDSNWPCSPVAPVVVAPVRGSRRPQRAYVDLRPIEWELELCVLLQLHDAPENCIHPKHIGRKVLL